MTRRLAMVAALLALIFVLPLGCSGCSADSVPCASTAQCRPAELCVQQRCQQCVADNHCGEGGRCVGGRCESKAEAAERGTTGGGRGYP